jgi:hypothetical protein
MKALYWLLSCCHQRPAGLRNRKHVCFSFSRKKKMQSKVARETLKKSNIFAFPIIPEKIC